MNDSYRDDRNQSPHHYIPPDVKIAACLIELGWSDDLWDTGVLPEEYRNGSIDFDESDYWTEPWIPAPPLPPGSGVASPPPFDAGGGQAEVEADAPTPVAERAPLFTAAGYARRGEAAAVAAAAMGSSRVAPETFGLKLSSLKEVTTKDGRRTTVCSGPPTKAFEDAWRARGGKIAGYTFKPNKKTGKMEVAFWQDLPEERISTDPPAAPAAPTAAAKPDIGAVAATVSTGIGFTRLTNSGGPCTKQISLVDGKMVKTPAAAMVQGVAERVWVADSGALAALIENLTSEQAITLGVLRPGLPDKVEVTTKASLMNGVAQPNLIARSGEYIVYDGPALTLIDYDTKGMPPTVAAEIERRGGFLKVLFTLFPQLKAAVALIRRSTSAGVFRADTGERLPESDGWHVYVLVKDGADSARFLRTLHERCWLAGFGWHRISKNGTLLERSIIDITVGRPERPVFEGAPILAPPLQQDIESRRPRSFNGKPLDGAAVYPSLPAGENAQSDALKAANRARVEPEARKVREAYVARKAKELIRRNPGMSESVARKVIERRCAGILYPDFVLLFDDPIFKDCTVGDVMADPARFEGATLADPLDEANRPDRAMIARRRSDGGPWIRSFAHGETWYSLKHDAASVRKAMEKAAKEEVVATFARLAAGADISPSEEEVLKNLAHELSGIGKRAIGKELKAAKQQQAKQNPKEDVTFRDYYVDTGEPKPSLANAVIALHALGIKARYDLFRHRIYVIYGGHSHTISEGLLTDNTTSAARSLINNTYRIDCGDLNTLAAIREIALENAYDPVLDQLDEHQSKWDGTKRIDTWAIVYLGCEDTPLTRAIGRIVMIAACRRARVPGCKFDEITVLEGPEGKNKSMLLQVWAGEEYFSDQSILGKSEKEQQEQREGIWIHEHADLDGMRKAEVNKVKADARRQKDRARPAYGRVREDRSRRSIDTGTTNDEEYLQSQTGNRCFWPLKTGTIDLEGFKRDREQLIGEAATYESAGESIRLDPSLWGDAGAEQEKRRVKHPWEDILAANIASIRDTGDGFERIASADILEHVLAIPRGQQNPSHGRTLAQVMKRIGWMTNPSGRVMINGEQVRGYIRPAVPTSGADVRGLMFLDALRTIDRAWLSLGTAGPEIVQAIAPHLGRIAPHLDKKDVEAQGAALLQRLRNAGWVEVVAKQLVLTAAGKEKLAAGDLSTAG
jgi:predicted P-loop ATPase